MSEATEIVNSALELLNLKSPVLAVDPEHQKRAFSALKDMLYTLEKNEMVLPLDIPSDIEDELDEDDWLTKVLKFLLAVESAPYLKATVSDDVAAAAKDCYDTLLIHSIDETDIKYPDTLPLGQGNRRRHYSRTYFK
jgi:hypothetical protein